MRYDIYGKNVAIANKMESGGVVGSIMISEETKKILDLELNSEYRFEPKEKMVLKMADKPIQTYLIHKKNE